MNVPFVLINLRRMRTFFFCNVTRDITFILNAAQNGSKLMLLAHSVDKTLRLPFVD